MLGWASLVLVGATVGLGLVLPRSQEQAEYSRLIAVHPPAAWASYVAVGVAAVAAVGFLLTRRAGWDRVTIAGLEVGAVFTAITLATGSIWGRPTWGVWWEWDARLTTEALLLAVLLGTVALRRSLAPGLGRAVITSVAAVATVGLLPVVHFSVQWWRSQHQAGTLLAPDPATNADNPYIVAMLVGFVAFTVLLAWMVVQRARIEGLEEEAEGVALEHAITERRAEGRPASGVTA
ncbi:MAG: Cytochrome c-type biogenesis protein CcmC, putative heme lyase for CcmE [uncultured Acidimicrobiales bacterium]|uniref:Heme exporter protein C n=1 Tax=uncultured Acidimicrobiales bacterium TaxID=310071 RepID=A0A6J4HIF0_9ACTN|nr:MAG: Cytochrome c-type biogenesis protein CcmC, putative heme lyase for CcmE [uncultured Acidimicrobiales bacterium]